MGIIHPKSLHCHRDELTVSHKYMGAIFEIGLWRSLEEEGEIVILPTLLLQPNIIRHLALPVSLSLYSFISLFCPLNLLSYLVVQ